MPTRAGTPIPPVGLPGGDLNPVDWNSLGGNMLNGMSPGALMRGKPVSLSWWQRRLIPEIPTVPQGVPVYLLSRGYSRGAGAYGVKLGVLPYSPIGAGIDATYKLPVIAGPGARYQFGAIFFDVQSIPTSLNINPTVPIETVDALIATSGASAEYLTTG